MRRPFLAASSCSSWACVPAHLPRLATSFPHDDGGDDVHRRRPERPPLRSTPHSVCLRRTSSSQHTGFLCQITISRSSSALVFRRISFVSGRASSMRNECDSSTHRARAPTTSERRPSVVGHSLQPYSDDPQQLIVVQTSPLLLEFQLSIGEVYSVGQILWMWTFQATFGILPPSTSARSVSNAQEARTQCSLKIHFLAHSIEPP